MKASASCFSDHLRDDFDPATWQEHLSHALDLAGAAQRSGAEPDETATRNAVKTYVTAYAYAFGSEPAKAFRTWLHDEFAALTDPRSARWWQLLAQVQPSIPGPPRTPDAISWLHRALARAVGITEAGSARDREHG